MIFPKKPSAAPQLGGSAVRAGVIGLHPLSGLLVGGGIGYALWHYFDAPWCFWLALFLGLAAGCRNAWHDIRLLLRENHERDTATKP